MNRIKKFFDKTGVCLVDLLKLDQPGKGKTELKQDLMALSAGGKSAVKKYYVKKIKVFFGVLAAGLILSLLSLIIYSGNSKEIILKVLGRPGYGEGDRKEALTVQVEGQDNSEELEITVQERKYTNAQKRKILDHALDELKRMLPGENESMDEVRQDLNFPVSLENGKVKVSWMTTPYGVISEDGSLKGVEEESGTLVEIEATLVCGGMETSYTTYANVFPVLLSEQEQIRKSIRKEVEEADARDSRTETLVLPDEVDGKKLVWMKNELNPFWLMILLTIVLSVCIGVEMDSKVHQKAEKRKRQLLLDYPDLMWKMTMLLGAGLSIKGTFTRIAEEYLREQRDILPKGRKQQKDNMRYVYEEVAYACYEMRNGIPESQAYERFGKRCQLPEYIRLGSVLSQNLKKGAKGLTSLLEKEAETSLNDRKNTARKIGEKAGTKLLLPMVLMLGIVLVILMVPAFLSF